MSGQDPIQAIACTMPSITSAMHKAAVSTARRPCSPTHVLPRLIRRPKYGKAAKSPFGFRNKLGYASPRIFGRDVQCDGVQIVFPLRGDINVRKSVHGKTRGNGRRRSALHSHHRAFVAFRYKFRHLSTLTSRGRGTHSCRSLRAFRQRGIIEYN